MALVAALSVDASAAPPSKEMTDPGSFWGVWGTVQTRYVTAPGLAGGSAQRLIIESKPGKPWDVGTFVILNKPVRKGDVLVLTFRARAQTPPPGSDLIMLNCRIYESDSSNSVSPDAPIFIGRQWNVYTVSGTAAKDYPAGVLKAGMMLGIGKMAIDFGPVRVFDLGPSYDLSRVPKD